jgi:hypothetical protein
LAAAGVERGKFTWSLNSGIESKNCITKPWSWTKPPRGIPGTLLCNDEILRRELESLLVHQKKAEHFIGSPVWPNERALTGSRTKLIGWTVFHFRVIEKLGGGSNPTSPAPDALILQIAGRVRGSAFADCGAPFIQLAVVHLPEMLAAGEVLQDHIRPALLDGFLGEGDLGPELSSC